jgi:hypothetical protein
MSELLQWVADNAALVMVADVGLFAVLMFYLRFFREQ